MNPLGLKDIQSPSLRPSELRSPHSPLRIAPYLLLRVPTADALARIRPANFLSNLLKTMEIHENPCKSMEIHGNPHKFMKIHENLCKSM